MSEEKRMAISLIAGAIVFVLCFIKVFLKGRSRKQKLIDKAAAKGHYQTATLIDAISICGNPDANSSYYRHDRMKCIYEYKVNGVSYKKKLKFRSQGTISIRYPYVITVYYNPKHPARGVCKEEATPGAQQTAGCCGTIVYTALAIIVISNLLKLI